MFSFFCKPSCLLVPFLVLAAAASGGASEPVAVRTQEVSLAKGWNAVFLEVHPVDDAPRSVFAGVPVDRVATMFGAPATNQFVTDPAADLSNMQGWATWYAPTLPEAFLGSLDAIPGNRAYLIHAREACQLRVKGQVRLERPRWQPDAYNFTGFSVRSPGGPTFGQFFAGSKALHNQAIYRLVEGRWKKVLQPTAEAMRAGEAFWIYCKGPSTYEGPLTVETEAGDGILVGAAPGRLVLRNASPHPLITTVEHVGGDGPPAPLSILIRTYGDPSAPVRLVPAALPAGPWTQDLPPMEKGGALAIPFERRSSEMSLPRQASLLKITTDLGTETWLPVTALRNGNAD